ncbi:MAG TPA: protein kinase [Pyrinomonadaceae bacterium]|nr:protein kinase [Pyrinomonadaceae bacterium]
MKKCPHCGKEYEDTNTLCPSDGTVLEKTSDPLVGQTLASKYRIEELINEGGMGAVYRGTHTLMDKTVAVKVLHPALAADDKIVARFSREARAASRISHPHALNVTDFGESENGIVFLVMEYLRGQTLKEVIRTEGPMSLTRAVGIIRQVSGALDAAHAQGVVHRDLKSDNIMLEDVGDGDWAKVLDFGIAKIQEDVGNTDPALTAANMIIGTPQYMSPEQCSQASEIDSRSDIYSLGVILYEMLAGHVPFTGDSPTAIMMQHLQDPPPSILEERADLPAAVGRVIARAMAKRPEDRYQSAGELSETLALAADGASPVVTEAATSPNSAERATNRIIVPTGPNTPPRDTANDDYDEATVVQPKREPVVAVQQDFYRSEVPPSSDRFNPWRIIIPAAAALLVAFVVVYALTRNSGQANTNQQAAPLVSDPNSLPAQPAQPATGQGEQGITSGVPTASPSVSPGSSTLTGGATPASISNQNQAATGASPLNSNSNGNSNSNAQANDNTAGQENTTPSPTPGKNTNQREKPSPQPTTSQNSNSDEPPALPTPTPKPKPALPKPTTAPSDVTPPQVGP